MRQVAARGGLKSLTPEQRAEIAPALNLDDPVYRRKGGPPVRLSRRERSPVSQEDFFAAQVVRDETMAHNLAQRLHPWPDGGKRGLVLAGAGHVAGSMGLAPRIAGVCPEPPPAPLGAAADGENGGLVVKRLIPGSPAQKAGVLPGDLLLAVDGKPLTSPKGIHDAIKAAPFAPHTYTLERAGRRMEINIALPDRRQDRAPNRMTSPNPVLTLTFTVAPRTSFCYR